MRQQHFWVKTLVMTNIISVFFLAVISFHYEIPKKILIRLGFLESNNNINSHYDERNSIFSEYYPKKHTIVMLGDSIVERVEWNELLGISNIANRGIGGDTTEGFYNRLSSIYKMEPELCFVMGGINDIASGVPVDKILKNIEKIIEALKVNNIRPIVQSTLYVSQEVSHWEGMNKSVEELNNGLKNICMENNITFIDINKILSEDGKLKNEYTLDGVHLLGIGYSEWGRLIKPIIENIK